MFSRLIYALFAPIALLLSVHLAQAQDSAYSAWTQSVRAKIEKGKRYPLRAVKHRIEGYVIVKFTVDRSGAVIQKLIDKTSCSAELDRAALATVQRASPFPPIPAHVQSPTLTLKAPMMFLMQKDDATRERIKAVVCPEVSAFSRTQTG